MPRHPARGIADGDPDGVQSRSSRLPHPFVTTPRLNLQQVATRSKGAPVSIGNSPEDDRPRRRPAFRSVVALQQARIAAGLTVDEVSTTTRVRVPIVQAIEQDDFSRCGGDVYARGHIRTLARAVGLDPDAADRAVRRRARRPRPRRPPRRRCSRPSGSAPSRAGPTGRPPWSPRSSPSSASSASPLFSGGDDDGRRSQVADGATPTARQRAQRRQPPDRPAQPAPKPEPSDSAIAARPGGQGHRQAHRRRRQELDLRQGPQRPAALRGRLLKQGESKTFTDNERDRPGPRQRRGGQALRQRQGGRGRVGDRARSSGSRYTKGDPEAG